QSPPKMSLISPLLEFFRIVPAPIKVTLALFVSSAVIVFVAFPTLMLYLPLLVLGWMFWRKRQNVKRQMRFQEQFMSMAKKQFSNTTANNFRSLEVADIVPMIEKRVDDEFRTDHDWICKELGMDPEKSRGSLHLGVCESADREFQILPPMSVVSTSLTFGLMQTAANGSSQRVGNVTAVIVSASQAPGQSIMGTSERESSSMKITLESHGKAVVLDGLHNNLNEENDTIIDVKPHD
ncbi:hypothetical protein V1512DRAFT_191696, partial [Lipomyces arxii]|uniref:uncharacterized protein n=1 Tax=Lipomyces arxii TaxID=56418 RepID=UPI0034CEAE2B